MNTAVFVLAALVALATIAIRTGGRIVLGQRPWQGRFALDGDTGDAMTHVLLAELIRRNRYRLPVSTPAFLLSGPQDYPAAFHWIVALFPKSVVEHFEWLFSPVIEAIHAVMVFGVLVVALHWIATPFPVELATLLTLVWITSPGLALDVRRGGFLNERVFGFLFSNTYFIAIAAWLYTGEPIAAIVALVAGLVVTVSSKFGMQALVFVTPLTSLALMDVRPLALLAIVAISSLVLSRGYAGFVWKGSVRHTRFYARYLVRVADYVNSFSMRQFIEAARQLTQGSVRTAARLVLDHPIAKIFTNSPVVWVAFAATAITGANGKLESILSTIVASSAVVALATSTDFLKHLGEGERYLEVAIAPSLLLLAAAVPGDLHYIAAGLLAYAIFRLWRAWHTLSLVRRNSRDASITDSRALLDWLLQQPARTIYPVPGRLAYPIAYAAGQHRYVWWFINAPERQRQRDFERLFDGASRYPYPSPQQVYASWGGERVEIAILHRATAAACKAAWGVDYDGIRGQTVFSNDTYVAIVPDTASPRQTVTSAGLSN